MDAPFVARTSGGGAATAKTLTLRFARAPRAALDTRPALRLDTTAPEGKAREVAHGQAANRHGAPLVRHAPAGSAFGELRVRIAT